MSGPTRAIKVNFGAIGLAALALIAGMVAAQAQTTVEKPSKGALAEPPAWSVDCSDGGTGLTCKARQAIVLAKTGQLIVSVSIDKPAADKRSPMLVRLPHGLFIPAGVAVSVDGAAPEALQIQTCDAGGCIRALPG